MSYPHYSCISKRAKTVNVTFKKKNKRTIPYLAIDFTGFTVYSEKIEQHSTDGKQ
ncbi:Mobile element protein [Candidatus Enterovibrio altilux]|uniref:Mobile element protein n=1 Tax=Candidatus Enterovibrio altilux TaxID=1927128 RepID=A0A291B9X2_9GAMM|nr:Mobile element protein [Candidatus Enterovibrio luxaltus]